MIAATISQRTHTFLLNAGGQNITIRRITGVSISPPATLKAGAGRMPFGVQLSFDSGQVDSPHLAC